MSRIHQATPEELDQVLDARGWRSEQDIRRNIAAEYHDHERFCSKLKIRNKSGLPVPFHLTPGGKRFAKVVDEAERAGRPVRIQVLKAGQVFMSSLCATFVFKRAAFQAGHHARVFADKSKNAQNIYDYVKQYVDTYEPGPGGVRMRGVPQCRVGEKMTWAGGSWIQFESAETATGGRSAAVRTLHNTEVAFWRDAERLRTGLLARVPNDPGTMVVDESTANGAGGPFFEQWQEITAPGYSGDWRPVFVAWHDHPEYMLETERLGLSLREFEQSLEREEEELRRACRLSLQQLAWRRWTIKNTCEGSIDRFHQEFPSNPEEAFLTSGRPRFCLISLGRMVGSRDFTSGSIQRDRIGTREQIVFVPDQRNKGEVQIFKRPATGRNYVIGVDPAEGILISESKKEPDSSVAYVADQDTGEQVACVHCRELEVPPFADIVCSLAEWYNWAFLVPLVNGMGLALMQEIRHLNYPETLIYHRDREPDDKRPALLQELGFRENTLTREQLISNHDRMIRELAINICCPTCIQQHRTFVRIPSGRSEHQEGCKDDAVLGAAACSMGLQQAPRVRALLEARKPKPVWEDPDDEDDRRGRNRYARRYR